MKHIGLRTVAAALVLALAAFLTQGTAEAASDPAAQQIQTFYDGLLDTMKHAKALGLEGRYEKLRPVVQRVYDLPTMTGLAVGPTWSSLAPADQKALIAAFERMTLANYAKNFDGYDGEKFIVDPDVQSRGDDRIVKSTLVAKDQTVPFVYRMRQTGGQTGGTWKIVDVYLNGSISELATRRSDFAATLGSGGASALVRKINDLADNVMKNGS
jgi:phospholipid transport system substrate-binding protein